MNTSNQFCPRRNPIWLFLCLLATVSILVNLAGCYTSVPSRLNDAPPAYARSTEHLRTFQDAAALAAYLRADSEGGPLVSAHRGGPLPTFPENAIETFERSLNHAPVIIETDIRMSRDSVLLLMHDETLERTTTGKGDVREHIFADLRRLLLKDQKGIITPFRIPSLDETLAWAQGRAILMLDVKENVAAEEVVAAIRRMQAEDRVVTITYSLDDLRHYYRLAPDLNYSVSAVTLQEAQSLVESGMDLDRLIVFTGVGEVQPELIELLHRHNIRAILGTFGQIDQRAMESGLEVYQLLLERGVDVISTDVVPLAARAINQYRSVVLQQ